jgi:hypothetical protein
LKLQPSPSVQRDPKVELTPPRLIPSQGLFHDAISISFRFITSQNTEVNRGASEKNIS